MPSQWFLYSYLLAGVAALLLLVVFRARRWYLHAISVLGGLLAGIVPPIGGAGGDWFYLLAGAACVFLLAWGAGGVFFASRPKIVPSTEPVPRRQKEQKAALT
jgi:hypothetical protein